MNSRIITLSSSSYKTLLSCSFFRVFIIFNFFISFSTPLYLTFQPHLIYLLPLMASSQLTASSISTRSVASFEGLRPSSVHFHSARHVRIGNPARRSFKALIVKAATVVAPKVYFHSFVLILLL